MVRSCLADHVYSTGTEQSGLVNASNSALFPRLATLTMRIEYDVIKLLNRVSTWRSTVRLFSHQFLKSLRRLSIPL